MAAEIVNLRRARKANARAVADSAAAANRAAYGRSKAEKALLAAERRLDDARLSGHRRPDDRDEP